MYNLFKSELQKFNNRLSDADYNTIERKLTIEKIPKGNYFLHQGDVCDTLGFLVSGFMRTYTINEKGNDVTTHFGYDGQFIVSFFSFKNQAPSFETIRALEDSVLITLSRTALHELFNEVKNWEGLYREIIESSYACMEQRNYILQNLSASEKYATLIEQGHPSILQKASLGNIASYLGIKQETLSRIRKKIR